MCCELIQQVGEQTTVAPGFRYFVDRLKWHILTEVLIKCRVSNASDLSSPHDAKQIKVVKAAGSFRKDREPLAKSALRQVHFKDR